MNLVKDVNHQHYIRRLFNICSCIAVGKGRRSPTLQGEQWLLGSSFQSGTNEGQSGTRDNSPQSGTVPLRAGRLDSLLKDACSSDTKVYENLKKLSAATKK